MSASATLSKRSNTVDKLRKSVYPANVSVLIEYLKELEKGVAVKRVSLDEMSREEEKKESKSGATIKVTLKKLTDIFEKVSVFEKISSAPPLVVDAKIEKAEHGPKKFIEVKSPDELDTDFYTAALTDIAPDSTSIATRAIDIVRGIKESFGVLTSNDIIVKITESFQPMEPILLPKELEELVGKSAEIKLKPARLGNKLYADVTVAIDGKEYKSKLLLTEKTVYYSSDNIIAPVLGLTAIALGTVHGRNISYTNPVYNEEELLNMFRVVGMILQTIGKPANIELVEAVKEIDKTQRIVEVPDLERYKVVIEKIAQIRNEIYNRIGHMNELMPEVLTFGLINAFRYDLPPFVVHLIGKPGTFKSSMSKNLQHFIRVPVILVEGRYTGTAGEVHKKLSNIIEKYCPEVDGRIVGGVIRDVAAEAGSYVAVINLHMLLARAKMLSEYADKSYEELLAMVLADLKKAGFTTTLGFVRGRAVIRSIAYLTKELGFRDDIIPFENGKFVYRTTMLENDIVVIDEGSREPSEYHKLLTDTSIQNANASARLYVITDNYEALLENILYNKTYAALGDRTVRLILHPYAKKNINYQIAGKYISRPVSTTISTLELHLLRNLAEKILLDQKHQDVLESVLLADITDVYVESEIEDATVIISEPRMRRLVEALEGAGSTEAPVIKGINVYPVASYDGSRDMVYSKLLARFFALLDKREAVSERDLVKALYLVVLSRAEPLYEIEPDDNTLLSLYMNELYASIYKSVTETIRGYDATAMHIDKILSELKKDNPDADIVSEEFSWLINQVYSSKTSLPLSMLSVKAHRLALEMLKEGKTIRLNMLGTREAVFLMSIFAKSEELSMRYIIDYPDVYEKYMSAVANIRREIGQ